MMNAKKILKMMEEIRYWDARIFSLECTDFGDEVRLVHEDDEFNPDVSSHQAKRAVYTFTGCYKILADYMRKDCMKSMAIRKMVFGQIAYAIQDISIEETVESGLPLYIVKLIAVPFDLEIWCEHIDVKIVKKEDAFCRSVDQNELCYPEKRERKLTTSPQEIQQMIDPLPYQNSRVLALTCNYCGDEVHLIHEKSDTEAIQYHFGGCYRVLIDHDKAHRKSKPIKDIPLGEADYFLQNIEIGMVEEDNTPFYTAKIDMDPIHVEILFEEIVICTDSKENIPTFGDVK